MSTPPQSQTYIRPVGLPATPTQRPSRLLAGIYHDIGMAAVAMSLELPAESLGPAEHEAVKRGARYIYLMPKRQDAPQGLPAE
jgi:hypothetical protein